MEKQKTPPSGPRKGANKRVLPPPGDFIALGKSSSAKPAEAKPSQVINRKPSIGTAGVPQKRKESTTTSSGAPSKQLRTFSPSFGRGGKVGKGGLETSEALLPTVKLIEAQQSELEDLVLAAHAKGDQDQVEGLLCGAMKSLKTNRLKPDQMIYLTLLSLAKQKPVLFTGKRVIEHFLQFLRRDTCGSVVKPKPNTLLCILTCNILLQAFSEEENWPQSFMKVYIEDSLGDRSWVDNEHNKEFVSNITAVFGTKLPSSSSTAVLQASTAKTSLLDMPTGTAAVSGSKVKEEKAAKSTPEVALECGESLGGGIQNRYPSAKDDVIIQTYIQDVLKDQLNKKHMIDSVSRNVLRFLTSVCGYADVRLLASQRLEAWLQNPKLTRPAQELLMSVALNCNAHSADDIDVIANLIRMRLKAKPVANHYVGCIKELLAQHPNNLGTTLKHVIYNELSQQRNQHNMAILSVIFTYDPESAAKFLAVVFQDLLCSREDFLRALRTLFREIVRFLRYEVNLVEFCRSIMQDRHEAVFTDLDQQYKDRMFTSVIDLICLGCFLCVSPVVKELSTSLAKGEKRDYSVLQAFQSQISLIQTDAVWFFHTKVLQIYRCTEKEFVMALNRVLFLEANEQYSSKDSWPPESERNVLLQLVQEVPLSEDALLRLLLLGLSEDMFINHADTLDVIEKMILRAASLKTGLQGLEVERTEVMQMLLSLSAYNHPKDIKLPTGYEPPPLAISNLYWKAWLMILVLAATNPTTLGLFAWETYPTMKCMMEMLITGCYQFPPLGVGDATTDEVRGNELQIARAEKEDIIVFEGHLAAATSGVTISESTSLLISQLMNLKPEGPPRQPPAHVIERLKMLNETYGLGKLLCYSREPDFLLFIIQSQGSSRSMPWLADLVQSSEATLNALPIQCLCEFLLMKQTISESDSHYSKHRSIRHKVSSRLHDLLLGSEATAESSNKLVKYFIQRWSSPEMKDREASVTAFQSILLLQKKLKSGSGSGGSGEASQPESRSNWLQEHLTSLPHFNEMKGDILVAIRETLTTEVDVPRLQGYVQFLCHHYTSQRRRFTHALIDNLASLITCRRTVSKNMIDPSTSEGITTYNCLIKVFASYVSSELRDAEVELTKDDKVNRIKVLWNKKSLHSEKYLVVHIKIVHACVVLLTYDCPPLSSDVTDGPLSGNKDYDFLLRTWFLEKGSYDVTDSFTGAEVGIFDEWLRVMMIQSNHKRLVQTGLHGSSPTQLIKYLQASGIPACNQSFLLDLLDVCSERAPEDLLNLIFDTDHFIQLVELAQARGAEGGDIFCKLLEADYQKEDESLTVEEISMDLSMTEVVEQQQVRDENMATDPATSTSEGEQAQLTASVVKEIIKDIIEPTDENKSKSSNQKAAFIEIKQVLCKSIISESAKGIKVANTMINVLIELCKQDTFLVSFTSNKKESINLLQLLSRLDDSKLDKFEELILRLNDSPSKTCLMEKLVSNICEKRNYTQKLSSEKKKKKGINDLLKSFVSTKNAGSHSTQTVEDFVKTLRDCDIRTADKENLVQAFLIVSKTYKSYFEQLVKVLSGLGAGDDVKIVVEILIQVMQAIDGQFSGLIVDWLTILDSEIVRVSPILQRQLLFSKLNTVPSNAAQATTSSTAFISSMLAHQTQNSTLQDCFTWILNQVRDTENLKATDCLDFLTAMINNPRLWQGRENRQKNEPEQLDSFIKDSEIILRLSSYQLYTLMQLILHELDQLQKKKGAGGNNGNGNDSGKDYVDVLDQRLTLLLYLSKKSTTNLHKAIKLVQQFHKHSKRVLEIFLRRLDAKNPLLLSESIKPPSLPTTTTNDEPCIPEEESNLPIDKLIHRLVLAVCEPTGTQEWEERFHCITSISRRLAVNHPHAFKRHLPLMLSMLHGKSRLTPGVFKLNNQLIYYTHVFGMLDVLRPHVFNDDAISVTTTTMFMEVFLELIQSKCLNGDQVASFVNKMVEYLNNCIASGNKWTGGVLKKYENLFKDLLYEFPNLVGLPFITTFISACGESSSPSPSLLAATSTPFNEVQLTTFKQRLSPRHYSKDLMNVLNDLDETSKRRIDILGHFVSQLEALTVSLEVDVRDKAHSLLLRHYKYQPRKTARLLDMYLEHFNSCHTGVVRSAAKHCPRAVLLSDRKCDVLLKRMFHLATSGHTELAGFIIECMKNLHVDY